MKKLVLTFFCLTMVACSGDPLNTKLTDANRKEIIQKVIPQLSETDTKTLLAFTWRHNLEKMGSALKNLDFKNPGKALSAIPRGDWSALPTGKSINDILKEQRDFETKKQ